MRNTAGAAFEPDARKLHIGHFAFMRAFHASTGLRFGAHVLDPRSSLDAHTLQLVVPASTAVVPLEKFVVSPRAGRQQWQGPQRISLTWSSESWFPLCTTAHFRVRKCTTI